MPISKAPYIRYTEETSIPEYGDNGSEIPIYIAPTKVDVTGVGNTFSEVAVDKSHIYTVTSYKKAKKLFNSTELLEVLRQYFEENDNYYGDELGSPYVYVIPLPLTPTAQNLSDALDLITIKRNCTAISILGITDPVSIRTELVGELNNEVEDGHLRIAYLKAPENTESAYKEAVRLAYIKDYTTKNQQDEDVVDTEGLTAFITANVKSYADAIALICEKINNPRIVLVEPEFYGVHLAKICNTPYYLEPGYLPYYSVDVGEFEERSSDERDQLCMSGLVFGEDDYTLPTVVPRMCLGVSTAFGKSDEDDYDTRTTDSLLHARRNVDHHIREILKIIAPQLKRNETSVILRYVQDEVMSYLDTELSKGTIMQYEFSVEESSYNPYCLLIRGKIVPVNSTLAIEFHNEIGAPYAIASDYV